MGRASDGWREPRLRLLRTAAVIVILALLVWLVAVEDGPTDTGAVGTLAGAMLVILGFEALVRLPGGKP